MGKFCVFATIGLLTLFYLFGMEVDGISREQMLVAVVVFCILYRLDGCGDSVHGCLWQILYVLAFLAGLMYLVWFWIAWIRGVWGF